MTVSTVDILVLHYVEVVHFHHNSCKSLKNFKPNHACAGQAQYHTFEVWLHRDATRPLQNFSNLWQPAKVLSQSDNNTS